MPARQHQAHKQQRQGKQQYDALNAVDAEWKNEDESMFGFAIQQVAIPSLVIVQPTSGRIPDKNKHIGQIYNTVTGGFFDSVELAFVGFNTPRAVLPYPFDVNAPQLCASPDSVRPYPKYVGRDIHAASGFDDLEGVIPEMCDGCPFNEAGLCTVMFRYFGYQMENGYPFTMRFKRTAMDAAKKLNFWLMQNEKGKQYTTFIMTTEERPTPQGSTFFVPAFQIGRDAREWLSNARTLHRALEDRIRRATEAPTSTPEEGE